MRLRIEASRARTRTSVKVITVFTVLFAVGLVVFNRDYLEPYDSVVGQLVLGLMGSASPAPSCGWPRRSSSRTRSGSCAWSRRARDRCPAPRRAGRPGRHRVVAAALPPSPAAVGGHRPPPAAQRADRITTTDQARPGSATWWGGPWAPRSAASCAASGCGSTRSNPTSAWSGRSLEQHLAQKVLLAFFGLALPQRSSGGVDGARGSACRLTFPAGRGRPGVVLLLRPRHQPAERGRRSAARPSSRPSGRSSTWS